MPTIRDVAQKAGVSVSAASYALSGSTKISPQTRARVQEAATNLGYYPSGTARNLKMRRTGAIGVFLPSYSGPIFFNIIQAIHNTAFPRNYEILVCSTQLSERLLLERHVDGAIILNTRISDDIVQRVQRADYPIVLMERALELPHVGCVLADNESGGYQAVRHLLDMGRRHIAILSGSSSNECTQRLAGARRALSEEGIDFAVCPFAHGDFSKEVARYATEALLAAAPQMNGLFCLSDEMAISAMQAIEASGRVIPRDVAVVGYDDIELSAYVNPPLTTISVDNNAWGQLAANTLIDMIEGKAGGQTHTIPVELVIRQSTGGYRLATLAE